jgi:hypothetical protein
MRKAEARPRQGRGWRLSRNALHAPADAHIHRVRAGARHAIQGFAMDFAGPPQEVGLVGGHADTRLPDNWIDVERGRQASKMSEQGLPAVQRLRSNHALVRTC